MRKAIIAYLFCTTIGGHTLAQDNILGPGTKAEISCAALPCQFYVEWFQIHGNVPNGYPEESIVRSKCAEKSGGAFYPIRGLQVRTASGGSHGTRHWVIICQKIK